MHMSTGLDVKPTCPPPNPLPMPCQHNGHAMHAVCKARHTTHYHYHARSHITQHGAPPPPPHTKQTPPMVCTDASKIKKTVDMAAICDALAATGYTDAGWSSGHIRLSGAGSKVSPVMYTLPAYQGVREKVPSFLSFSRKVGSRGRARCACCMARGLQGAARLSASHTRCSMRGWKPYACVLAC